jgi:hypothetical protein
MRIDELLAAELRSVGRDLATAGVDLRAFAATQAIQLAALAGHAGYEDAFKASVEMIGMRAGLSTIAAADASDARSRSLIMGFLAGVAQAT